MVISGKGGTGKTSLTAAFASMAGRAVLADCDVDAADLHLLLQPRIQHQEEFQCGNEAVIRMSDCTGCARCEELCRFDAVFKNPDGTFSVDPTACEGCGVCVNHCPVTAIDFPERIAGKWFISETRYGPMVHARLTPGGENSGKLVALVREQARKQAAESQCDCVLVDGPPGIGCPVIASLTGAALALVVAEPTLSGQHDLERVLKLTGHFKIPTLVCVNKWDINPEQTAAIEQRATELGARVAGRIRYDRAVTEAQVSGRSIAEWTSGAAAEDVREIWDQVRLCKAG